MVKFALFKNKVVQAILLIITIPLWLTVLSYIFYKSDNIFISISLHALHNFILLLIQFIGG